MLRRNFNFLAWSVVSIVFFPAHAGAFEDFFRAVRRDDASAVLGLMLRGFDPNTRDEKGLTGLHIALRDGNPKVAQLLAGTPALEPNLLNRDGESTLMMACLRGQDAIARVLVERGADVNKPGWTPLHYAASGGHAALVAYLLEENAYIDAESPNGTTPLMMAARYGSTAAVKVLLESGADPSLRNRQGLSALDFARQGERPDAVALVGQAMGRWRQSRPARSW